MPDKAEVWIATLHTRSGPTGVQTHMNCVADWLQASGTTQRWITPYEYPRSIPRRAASAFGLLLRRVSRLLAIAWNRYWLARDLYSCLSRRGKAHSGGVVFYAQDPLSALTCNRWAVDHGRQFRLGAVCHFNGTERDEWELAGIAAHRWGVGDRLDDLERSAVQVAHNVVTPSEWLRQELAVRHPDIAPRLTVLPNTANEARLLLRRKPQYDMITVGTLEPRKNQRLLIMLMEELKSRGNTFTLGIIGDGPDRTMLEALVNESDLVGLVTFLGLQDDVFRYLAASRVYVHAALVENLPIAILEAAAAGLPVLTTPSPGAREIVRDRVEGFYLDSDDVSASATRAEALLLDDDLVASMGQAARRRFETTYSSRIVRRKFYDLISQEMEAIAFG